MNQAAYIWQIHWDWSHTSDHSVKVVHTNDNGSTLIRLKNGNQQEAALKERFSLRKLELMNLADVTVKPKWISSILKRDRTQPLA